MTPYWVYCRLNVSVGLSNTEVTAELLRYADRHVKGGREAITPDVIGAILMEHKDARELYGAVMRAAA